MAATTLNAAIVFAQPQQGGQPQSELVRQGQQLARQGKFEEAFAQYQKEIEANPNSYGANNAAGVVLDLMGRTKEAKKYFAKAIEAASPQQKPGAYRAMAMSYAFDNDCKNTVKYEQMAFDHYVSTKDFYMQGEMANEAARVCIEAGDYDTAEKFYRLGTESGLKQPDIPAERVSLWNYRLEHALARLAARRGKKAEAQKHVAAAKAILDKDPEMAKQQAIFYPYLVGYVALYTGDPKTAVEELSKANQNDPFIQTLIGQAHEKLGDKEKAMEAYKKAAATTGHNPPAAYSRPFALKKLG
jgi:tetratricopeptide (TPR) repeat protein